MGKQKSDARVLLPIGLVLLGVSAAANNRPEKQPGSTTTWFLPPATP